jgi:hypothetical protein
LGSGNTQTITQAAPPGLPVDQQYTRAKAKKKEKPARGDPYIEQIRYITVAGLLHF